MRDVIESAACVLFDFDGPVCDLFYGHPAPSIARRLRGIVTAHTGGTLPAWMPDTDDPYRLLSAADSQHSRNGLATRMENALTEEEVEAAPRARPTAHADRLVHALWESGRQLAITTNNSRRAVERYLHTRSIAPCFAGHIHGRTPEVMRLKPDPYCLERALESTGRRAGEALMIGDAARDHEAAEALGVAFLGYARNSRKESALRAAGAKHIVGSLAEVLAAVDPADAD